MNTNIENPHNDSKIRVGDYDYSYKSNYEMKGKIFFPHQSQKFVLTQSGILTR